MTRNERDNLAIHKIVSYQWFLFRNNANRRQIYFSLIRSIFRHHFRELANFHVWRKTTKTKGENLMCKKMQQLIRKMFISVYQPLFILFIFVLLRCWTKARSHPRKHHRLRNIHVCVTIATNSLKGLFERVWPWPFR